MTDKEKLDKMKKLADAMYHAAQYLTTDASKLHKAMEDYHQFIINDYCKEEPASEDLEQAAQEYTEKGSKCQDEMDAFIAGAEWMARRFSKLYAEKFLSMQVQEPIPEPIQKVVDDHWGEMI